MYTFYNDMENAMLKLYLMYIYLEDVVETYGAFEHFIEYIKRQFLGIELRETFYLLKKVWTTAESSTCRLSKLQS